MPSIALSHRAILRRLLEAGEPVLASELAKAGGFCAASHITVAMSTVRAAIKPYGARLVSAGVYEALNYCVEAEDLAPLHALAAVPEGRVWFEGFADTPALILRAIVEAGGQPVPMMDIVAAAYPKAHPYRQPYVREAVERIREKLAARGSSETILHCGRPGAPAYAWGPVTDDAEEIPLRADGITLPPVGGAYHFAAGRLTLDGRPAGRAA